jgi:hypothetical protein
LTDFYLGKGFGCLPPDSEAIPEISHFYWSADCLFVHVAFHLFSILFLTALLICMENTFWSIEDGNFVELFKKSFELYVESGMRKKIEADIFGNGQGGHLVTTEDGKAEFYMFITRHFLCKIHCFFMRLLVTCLIT